MSLQLSDVPNEKAKPQHVQSQAFHGDFSRHTKGGIIDMFQRLTEQGKMKNSLQLSALTNKRPTISQVTDVVH